MTTTRTREPAIRVQGIEKSIKDLHVLRGVDFDVKAGSIFALLGSNDLPVTDNGERKVHGRAHSKSARG